jgi:hypothetical protein
MPYIADFERRKALDNGDTALNAGELNYQISRRVLNKSAMCHSDKADIIYFIKRFLGSTPNYQKWNDVVGVLVCSSEELFRRELIDEEMFSAYYKLIAQLYDCCISPYEDKKCSENGDILE